MTYHLQITRDEWVAALRSGKYEQTNDQLWSEDLEGNPAYCCIGVACEIDPGMDRIEEGFRFENDTFGGVEDAELSESLLPDWMNMCQQSAAVAANDYLGWTFTQIADWVAAGMKLIPNEDVEASTWHWLPDETA